MLKSYIDARPARFHMPGHKGKLPLDAGADITELSFSDNLLSPCGVIDSAQRRAAELCGAARTFFLTNGSTLGIFAMMLSLPRGSTVALQRDCHKSAISAAAVAGLNAVFFLPQYDETLGRPSVVSATDVERCVRSSPDVAAIFVTHPNYYGECPDIAAISRHKGKALLFVDEAHGAHFRLNDCLPQSSAPYADLLVQSAHKTLMAPNQSAYLHCGHGCPKDIIHRACLALSMLQTTSPSYLMLDALSRQMAYDERYSDVISRVNYVYRALGAGLEPGRAGAAASDCDKTRMSIDVSQRGITGFAALRALEERGVYMEMADERRVVGICTPQDDFEWYERLVHALPFLPYGRQPPGKAFAPSLPEMTLPLWQAAFAGHETLPLSRSVGRISSAPVGAYPPGSALLIPGAVIGEREAHYLSRLGNEYSLYGAKRQDGEVYVDCAAIDY